MATILWMVRLVITSPLVCWMVTRTITLQHWLGDTTLGRHALSWRWLERHKGHLPSWPPPTLVCLALLTIVALVAHPDGATWVFLRKLRDGMYTLLSTSSAWGAWIFYDCGALFSSVLALATFVALFLLAWVIRRTLAPRPKPEHATDKKKKKRKPPLHPKGNNYRGGRIPHATAIVTTTTTTTTNPKHNPTTTESVPNDAGTIEVCASEESHRLEEQKEPSVTERQSEYDRPEIRSTLLPALSEDKPLDPSPFMSPNTLSPTIPDPETLVTEDSSRNRAASGSTVDTAILSDDMSYGSGSTTRTLPTAMPPTEHPTVVPMESTLCKGKNVAMNEPESIPKRPSRRGHKIGSSAVATCGPPQTQSGAKGGSATSYQRSIVSPSSKERNTNRRRATRKKRLTASPRLTRGAASGSETSIAIPGIQSNPLSPAQATPSLSPHGSDSLFSTEIPSFSPPPLLTVTTENDLRTPSLFSRSVGPAVQTPVRFSNNGGFVKSSSPPTSTRSVYGEQAAYFSTLNPQSPSWTGPVLSPPTILRAPPGLGSVVRHGTMEQTLLPSEAAATASLSSSHYKNLSLPSVPVAPRGCMIMSPSPLFGTPHPGPVYGSVKENPFADEDDEQIAADLQELGGRMVGSILDF
jgi:hypothetical protein